MPPKSEFVAEESQEPRRPVNTFYLSNERQQTVNPSYFSRIFTLFWLPEIFTRPTGCKLLTFLLRPRCNAIRVRTPPVRKWLEC